jgi:hypothetical protein
MLELPVTIRVPRPGEMRHRTDIEELLEKRKQALITQGFDWKDNTTPQLPFNFYAAINIHNKKLWELFIALSMLFPGEINGVYGLDGKDSITTGLLEKAQVLQAFSRFQTELTMDGLLSFGLLSHTRAALIEITVTESKYIKFWGLHKEPFLEIMDRFKVPNKPRLEFIDEYPKIVEPLKKFFPSTRKPEEVIWSLNRAFNIEQ